LNFTETNLKSDNRDKQTKRRKQACVPACEIRVQNIVEKTHIPEIANRPAAGFPSRKEAGRRNCGELSAQGK